MKKTSMMMLAAFSACFCAFSQEASVSTIAVTNLSDSLGTRIEYDKSTGIDIRRLNLDSIHADKHKSRITTTKNMSISTPKLRSVMMVKPLLARSDDGKVEKIDNAYISSGALKKLDRKNLLVDGGKTKSILVQDLSPSVLYLNGLQLSRVGTKSFSVSDVSVKSLNVGSISLASLTPYMPSISTVGLDSLGIKKLEANLLAVQTLNPQIINVTDASTVSSIMVIDNSKFKVEVTEETYAELAEMKLIYDFEQSYNESIKSEVKLNDVKKLERKMYLKWINLLAANKKCSISLVKNDEVRKIIGEAWINNGNYGRLVKENMLKNLKYLRSKGYDTVLVRFQCTEDINQLKQMINDIKDDGFEVFCTYVGLDNQTPRWNPYIEPETIEKYFEEIAPLCVGYLLNWRSTSNHVKILPIEYFNYLCNTLRKFNDKILIYGEVYYGNIDPLRMRTLIYTAPENVTGVMINNMGYYGYNITYAVNSLFSTSVPGYRKMDKLGQVIGVAPYYCSRETTKIPNLTLEKEYSYKAKVEKAFNKTNHGTVTMLHDGVDDNQTCLLAEPGDKHWTDTTDNILYDTKVWKMAEEEAAGKSSMVITR